MHRIVDLVTGRKTGSLLTGLSFLVVSVSGVLSFASPYTDRLAGVHTVAGFGFIAGALIHVAHNGTTWLRYVRGRRRAWPSRPFVLAVALTATLPTASLLRAAPVRHLLAWGIALRKSDVPASVPEKANYETRVLDVTGPGPLLTVDVTAGPFFHFVEPEYNIEITPQMAVWTEDEEGHLLETLSVTRDEGRSGYDEGDDVHSLTPRPAALPVWAHKIGVQHGKTALEDKHAAVPDVVSTASPRNNVTLVTRPHTDKKRFAVVLELNSSFDFNDYYRRDSFPDEIGYSKGGFPAQPSVVYRAWVEPGTSSVAVMTPIGHGHHAGADGTIDPDLSQLTTALEIVDRVVVEVRDEGAPGKR